MFNIAVANSIMCFIGFILKILKLNISFIYKLFQNKFQTYFQLYI